MKTTRYYGTVHADSSVTECGCPAQTPMEMLAILARLNRESHVYGITYWTRAEDFNIED